MKKAILLAAYGAGTVSGRDGIRAFEGLCKTRFPDIPLRWAYTSLKLRERIALERQKSDSVRKALMRLYFEKYESVAIQPLQTISGREYEDVFRSAMGIAEEKGLKIALGKPLLSQGDNLEIAARALLKALPPERAEDENVIFMGHGARHPAVNLYDSLACILSSLDKNVFIGTLSGTRRLEKILPQLCSKRVWLIPLLSLVGGHALSDMAGDNADSWKSRINSSRHECIPVMRGLSQSEAVAQIWLDNLAGALKSLENQKLII